MMYKESKYVSGKRDKQFKDNVKSRAVAISFDELDNIRMVHFLQHGNLAFNAAQKLGARELCQTNDLDGKALACPSLAALADVC